MKLLSKMELFSIVGGTYYEKCDDPYWDELYGSGFRACVALASIVNNINFYTFADSATNEVLQVLARQLNLKIKCDLIQKSVLFHYQHPLSNPEFYPDLNTFTETSPIILAGHKNVLSYGMIEGNAKIEAEKVVYDPQRPSGPTSFWQNGSLADELIMILNYKEASKIAGSDDLEIIKNYLLNKERVGIAIIKNGAEGAFLIEKSKEIDTIPAFLTSNVWPIGSGDIYSAYFAYQYLLQGNSVYESAYQSSMATAWYVNNKLPTLPTSFLKENFTLFKKNTAEVKKVYLAGPFFNMAQRWMINEVREALIKVGLQVFSPLHDVGIGGFEDVVAKDIEAIKVADIIVAIGDGLDSGTLFEIGYARALSKPILVLIENEHEKALTMLKGTNCKIETDLSTLIYKAFWEAYK